MQTIAQTESEATEARAKANGGITKFKTTCAFFKNGACSKTLMCVLQRSYGQTLPLEEAATEPLAGGLMQGYQCGMLWGSSLAAGAQAHRLHGPGPRAEGAAVRASQRLVGAFRECNGHVNCMEITETDPKDSWRVFVYFLLKGGTVDCIRRINRYAPRARAEIDAALDEPQREGTCSSASCAALLARKMGASEEQATMAAGLAGGIGLNGGACGALGAAIWLLGIKGREAGLKRKVINKQVEALTERFLKRADYEVECSEIVGRTFEGVDDHATYVQGGGCAELIDALAAAAAELSAERAAEQPAVDQPAVDLEDEGAREDGAAAAA